MGFGFVFAILFSGFVTGGLARFAVPGPDPMPIWLTTAIGLTGSIVGAVVGRALSDGNGYVVSFTSLGVAVALVLAYRRFIQHRPLTGEGALAYPKEGFGVSAFRNRLRKLGVEPDALRRAPKAPTAPAPEPDAGEDRLGAALDELHRAGLLDEEELIVKRAALERRAAGIEG